MGGEGDEFYEDEPGEDDELYDKRYDPRASALILTRGPSGAMRWTGDLALHHIAVPAFQQTEECLHPVWILRKLERRY